MWLLRKDPALWARLLGVSVGGILWIASALGCWLLSGDALSRTEPSAWRGRLRRWARRTAVTGLFAVPILGGVALLMPQREGPSRTPGLVILVATFDGKDDEYGLTESILEQLREALKGFPDVEVRPLGHKITVAQGPGYARECGEREGAAIVLWGWYRDAGRKARIVAHFEILKRPRHFVLNDEKRSVLVDGGELSAFTVQQRVSEELSGVVLVGAALSRYEAGDFDGAVEGLTKVIDHYAVPEEMVSTSVLYLLRGNAYRRKDDLERAIADFDRVLSDVRLAEELKEGVVKAYMGRGIARAGKKEYALAIEDFDGVLRFEPNSAVAWANRSAMSGERRDYKRAISDADKAVKADPEFAGAYLNRAVAHIALKDYGKAFADLRRIIALGGELVAEAYYGCGNVYFELEKFDAAIAEYDEALRVKPAFARALYSRGNAMLKRGDAERAISDQTAAITLNPHFTQAYLHRGNARVAAGQMKIALDDFDAAVALDPRMVEAYMNRGATLAKLGRLDDAITDYDSALKLDPNNYQLIFNRGVAYGRKRESEKAIKDYTRALDINPRSLEALVNRGNLYAKQNERELALKDYGRAIEIDRDYVLTYLARRRFYFREKRYVLAERDFSEAARLSPTDPDPLLLRAMSAEERGDVERAEADYRRAQELSADPRVRAATEQKLQKLRPR